MRRHLRGALAVLAALCVISIGAFAQTDSSRTPAQSTMPKTRKAKNISSSSEGGNGQLTAAESAFLKKANQGNLAEIELGKLATEKAQNTHVKQFGQRMVDDHSKANDHLKQVAEQVGVQLPNDLSAHDQGLRSKLSALSGEQFDRAYMRTMVQDHHLDVNEFTREARDAKNPTVKNFASQTLPVLKSHLQEAQKIQSAENKPMKEHKGTAGASTNPKP